jgi:hypothetical protein
MKMKQLPIIAVALLLSACGSTKEAAKPERTDSGYMDDLRKYEAQFRPSDYDVEIEAILKADKENTLKEKETPAQTGQIRPQELVTGFRVQIYSSTNIDQANEKKAQAEARFPGEWFYIVYDPPTYKLRAGNFLARFEADRFAQHLAEEGYRDAWIVPERVYKNPPPRSIAPDVKNKNGTE